ncbi:MAG: hypothetical protein IE884_08160 [Sulfuricurvum sp.]|nr:hypothetical protein [Sulfuricurvum sp.]
MVLGFHPSIGKVQSFFVKHRAWNPFFHIPSTSSHEKINVNSTISVGLWHKVTEKKEGEIPPKREEEE